MNLSSVAEHLNKRRYHAKVFASATEAKAEILRLIGTKSVGIGGSNTMKSIDMYDTLVNQGNTVYCHTYAPKEQADAIRRGAMDADVYLCSANAVTEDGRIINIDGTGNRVAATIFGPKTVILLVGRNKIAANIEDGIARIKRENCPKNARRLGLDTPCAKLNECMDCSSPARMCNVTIIHEYPTRNVEAFYVFLVDEDIGW